MYKNDHSNRLYNWSIIENFYLLFSMTPTIHTTFLDSFTILMLILHFWNQKWMIFSQSVTRIEPLRINEYNNQKFKSQIDLHRRFIVIGQVLEIRYNHFICNIFDPWNPLWFFIFVNEHGSNTYNLIQLISNWLPNGFHNCHCIAKSVYLQDNHDSSNVSNIGHISFENTLLMKGFCQGSLHEM